ncbi:MAG TPA: helix-hairpin-helix domain-containing protein [Candidatus Acidoferrales bacterium]|jgi:competence ComEA-like helix-hairpin-helix protein|nr:helix-hairpin-helix domain-containing protein [Candidatus Acidoferrales bacterium]
MLAKLSRIGALTFYTAVLVIFCTAAHAEKNPPSKPIDLNVANLKELQELPGVGAVTAQRIIDLREKSGRFHRVEDLLAVRGISTKKLEAMRKYITVSAAPAVSPPTKKTVPPAKSGSPCTGCSTPNNK